MGILEDFSKKNAQQKYSVGDTIYLSVSSDGVPAGTQFTILGFEGSRVPGATFDDPELDAKSDRFLEGFDLFNTPQNFYLAEPSDIEHATSGNRIMVSESIMSPVAPKYKAGDRVIDEAGAGKGVITEVDSYAPEAPQGLENDWIYVMMSEHYGQETQVWEVDLSLEQQ
jgi:hypothetical protein